LKYGKSKKRGWGKKSKIRGEKEGKPYQRVKGTKIRRVRFPTGGSEEGCSTTKVTIPEGDPGKVWLEKKH